MTRRDGQVTKISCRDQSRGRDGEVVVVTDVVTPGLQGVAVKVLLLDTPDLLTGHQEDLEPEDENDGEPDTAERSEVLVHPAEEPLKEGPVHSFTSDESLDALNLDGSSAP